MYEPYDLKVLFATSYSDSCYRSIRAVAQLADAFRISLTIAHVGEPSLSSKRDLHSFFAEADLYDSCERVQLQGSPATALADLARKGAYDLILAPCSHRIGIPRPFHRAFRAKLMRSARLPLWTGSTSLDGVNFLRPYRTIAVGIDGRDNNLNHLNLAAAFAQRVGAQLRLLTVVPNVHEGTLHLQARSPEPLSEEVAAARIEKMLSHWNQIPSVDIAIGSSERELPRLTRQCEADLLFLPESLSCKGFFVTQLCRAVDHSPCNVICVPKALPSTFKWGFEATAHAEKMHQQQMATLEVYSEDSHPQTLAIGSKS